MTTLAARVLGWRTWHTSSGVRLAPALTVVVSGECAARRGMSATFEGVPCVVEHVRANVTEPVDVADAARTIATLIGLAGEALLEIDAGVPAELVPAWAEGVGRGSSIEPIRRFTLRPRPGATESTAWEGRYLGRAFQIHPSSRHGSGSFADPASVAFVGQTAALTIGAPS